MARPLLPDRQLLLEAIAVSKFKVEWAKKHVSAVEHFVKQTIAHNTDLLTIDNNRNPAIIAIRPSHPLPIELVLHAGDAIHNLNAVTDYLWTGLGKAVGRVSLTRSSFPRHKTRKELADSINKSRLENPSIYMAFPQAESFILDIVKSYKGGNEDPSFIWRLNKLDNINKHRLLLIIAHFIQFEDGFSCVGADGGRYSILPGIGIYTQGQPFTIALASPVTTDNQPKTIVDVVFNEPDLFAGKPIVETLVDLTNAIGELVAEFEKTFV